MNEGSRDSVCAVVVTYNRKNLLLECLEALRKQTRPIQGIYLIDNASTDGTPEILFEKGYIKELPPKNVREPWENEFEIKNLTNRNLIKLHYVRMHKNTGGAGGFYEGVKRAYGKGYDWLWLMDDDAEPKEDSLERLDFFFKKRNVVGLAGSVVLPNNNIAINHRGKINLLNIFPLIQSPLDIENYQKDFVEIDMASFVGLLVSKDAIAKIGSPKKDFFIHHDDVEYCIRLRTIGKILLIPKSIIVHKEAAKDRIEKRFLWKKSYRIPYDKFWLTYYGKRNLVWLGKKYSTNKFNFWKGFIISFLRSIIGIALFDDYKLKRINFVINAYFDGLIGKFGNEKPKKILYK